MGKLIAYCLSGCPHSENTKSVLTKLKLLLVEKKSTDFNINIELVPNNSKDKDKIKTSLQSLIGNYSTFPIIIYKTSKNEQYFIGGNSDLKNMLAEADKANVSDLKTVANCVDKLSNNEGYKRLLCQLLLLTGKIN